MKPNADMQTIDAVVPAHRPRSPSSAVRRLISTGAFGDRHQSAPLSLSLFDAHVLGDSDVAPRLAAASATPRSAGVESRWSLAARALHQFASASTAMRTALPSCAEPRLGRPVSPSVLVSATV